MTTVSCFISDGKRASSSFNQVSCTCPLAQLWFALQSSSQNMNWIHFGKSLTGKYIPGTHLIHYGHRVGLQLAERGKTPEIFSVWVSAPTILPRMSLVWLLGLIMQTQLLSDSDSGDVHSIYGVRGCSACVPQFRGKVDSTLSVLINGL